jgi:uncharacterized surface protein with fasciclin (FAS1) repeats
MKTEVTKMNSFKMISRIFLLAVIVVIAASCEEESMEGPSKQAMAYQESDEASELNARRPNVPSIAEIAIDNGFSELVSALSYVDTELDAGLVDLFLNGSDQYTVFAPTNAAFSALYGALNVNAITDLPAELVLDVLQYHVTRGRRSSNSVVPPTNHQERFVRTLLGEEFYVNSDAMIEAIGNTANIVAADIPASNGIVHVIDAVILPIE